MGRIFHLAIAVQDVNASVEEYNERIGQAADVVVDGQYALWRTKELNFSIRKASPGDVGKLRHIGWEMDDVPQFTCDKDSNGILWEEFTAKQQAAEIDAAWPGTGYKVKKLKVKKEKKKDDKEAE
ncbi:hypothetical protein BTA51_15675 [Hahella sp. CCB-MM4]|uniref:hypothetical protein n=1 Tax=Hahella sp. (strain CCB-MM4) TaxID=1926491 RepID=UPI000B9C2B95|nr:hypothetical protein [Hahella sp. CCB-MM4]OZG72554.1 hypothetical protein BTA51_15675 [Hahella sp. CCB-MM4]